MKKLKLDDFQKLALSSESIVMNIKDFNVNIRLYHNNYIIDDCDKDLLHRRTQFWESSGNDFGSEYFIGKDGKINGVITYGLIS